MKNRCCSNIGFSISSQTAKINKYENDKLVISTFHDIYRKL